MSGFRRAVLREPSAAPRHFLGGLGKRILVHKPAVGSSRDSNLVSGGGCVRIFCHHVLDNCNRKASNKSQRRLCESLKRNWAIRICRTALQVYTHVPRWKWRRDRPWTVGILFSQLIPKFAKSLTAESVIWSAPTEILRQDIFVILLRSKGP